MAASQPLLDRGTPTARSTSTPTEELSVLQQPTADSCFSTASALLTFATSTTATPSVVTPGRGRAAAPVCSACNGMLLDSPSRRVLALLLSQPPSPPAFVDAQLFPSRDLPGSNAHLFCGVFAGKHRAHTCGKVIIKSSSHAPSSSTLALCAGCAGQHRAHTCGKVSAGRAGGRSRGSTLASSSSGLTTHRCLACEGRHRKHSCREKGESGEASVGF